MEEIRVRLETVDQLLFLINYLGRLPTANTRQPHPDQSINRLLRQISAQSTILLKRQNRTKADTMNRNCTINFKDVSVLKPFATVKTVSISFLKILLAT